MHLLLTDQCPRSGQVKPSDVQLFPNCATAQNVGRPKYIKNGLCEPFIAVKEYIERVKDKEKV